jgi:hypothetical protein
MGQQNHGAHRHRRLPRLSVLLVIAGLLIGAIGGGRAATAAPNPKKAALTFDLVRSAAAETADCLPDAAGTVKISQLGFAEKMQVSVSGLPANTEFDLFVIQVPDASFGLSWYQGDLETNNKGRATKSFIGRFNGETFIVAPGSAPAPIVHAGEDAATNPATDPVHTAHLGLWFNTPEDADAAGCGDAVTPFNGDHTAGVQVLSTRQFDDIEGPLLQLGS